MYKLTDKDGKEYYSEIPGEFGGNSKDKIYGRFRQSYMFMLKNKRRFGIIKMYRDVNINC